MSLVTSHYITDYHHSSISQSEARDGETDQSQARTQVRVCVMLGQAEMSSSLSDPSFRRASDVKMTENN